MTNILVTLIDSMGSDLTIVNAARVSFGKKKDSFDVEKDSKLIRYLARNRHTSPFGHCFASFHVCAPVFVARQLVKHKFLRWNEISRRYVDDEPEFYQPSAWRGRSEDKKQGSSGEVRSNANVHYFNENALRLYKQLLDEGVAPEQARMVLPASLMTEWYWSGSLDAFADMCNLRCTDDTQAETSFVADAIDEEMEQLFPVSWKELRNDSSE